MLIPGLCSCCEAFPSPNYLLAAWLRHSPGTPLGAPVPGLGPLPSFYRSPVCLPHQKEGKHYLIRLTQCRAPRRCFIETCLEERKDGLVKTLKLMGQLGRPPRQNGNVAGGAAGAWVGGPTPCFCSWREPEGGMPPLGASPPPGCEGNTSIRTPLIARTQ